MVLSTLAYVWLIVDCWNLEARKSRKSTLLTDSILDWRHSQGARKLMLAGLHCLSSRHC